MPARKRSLAAVSVIGVVCLGSGAVLWHRYAALDTSHWTTTDAISEMVDHPAAAAAVLRRDNNVESKLALAMDIGLLLPNPEVHKDEVNSLLNSIAPPPLGNNFGFDGTAASFIPYLNQEAGDDVEAFPLTCKMILRYPMLLGATDPVWGGHRDDFNAHVDCNDAKYQLSSSIQNYVSALNALSGFGGFCGAAGDFADQTALINSYFFNIVQYAPRSLLPPYANLGDGSYDIQHFAISSSTLPLQVWGETDIDSYQKAKVIGSDFLKARSDLTAYYQASFGLSQADAQLAALHGVWLLDGALQWTNGGTADPLAEALLNHQPLTQVKAVLANESPAPASMLFLAVKYPKALKLLLNQYPDLTITTPIGKTVLMEAAKYNQLESVNLLLAAGVNADAASLAPGQIDNNVDEEAENDGQDCWTLYHITHGGRTALMYAAANASLPVINALLAAGVDTGAKDSAGLTALDYLEGRGPVAKNPLLSPAGFQQVAQELGKPNPLYKVPPPPPMAAPAPNPPPPSPSGQISI